MGKSNETTYLYNIVGLFVFHIRLILNKNKQRYIILKQKQTSKIILSFEYFSKHN
jgi:hypothetical protein